MSKLGPDARALVESGRNALRPTAGDRQRVLQALRSQIGDGAGAQGGGAGPPGTGAGGVGWKVVSTLLAGLAVVGAIVFQSLRPDPVDVPSLQPPLEAPPPPAVTPTQPARVEAASIPERPPSIAPATPPVERRAPLARRPKDRLAEEVRLLSRAENDLHARRFASALRLLDEHQRKFPNGALSEERFAARIRALCALGRSSEAKAELERLTRLSPGSPHEGRAREACARNQKN